MPGTVEGGRKAAATNKKKYGDSFYANIGRKGGKNGHTGGFNSDKVGKDGLTGPERAKIAGQKGGRKSKRGPAIRLSGAKIKRIKRELAEAETEELKAEIRLLNMRLKNAEEKYRETTNA